jgi:hypothetical protein
MDAYILEVPKLSICVGFKQAIQTKNHKYMGKSNGGQKCEE